MHQDLMPVSLEKGLLRVCVCPHGGTWSRGVPGPRGCLVLGGCLVQGGVWSWGVPGPRGVPAPGGTWWRPPWWLLLWVVHILLECIFVYMNVKTKTKAFFRLLFLSRTIVSPFTAWSDSSQLVYIERRGKWHTVLRGFSAILNSIKTIWCCFDVAC